MRQNFREVKKDQETKYSGQNENSLLPNNFDSKFPN